MANSRAFRIALASTFLTTSFLSATNCTAVDDFDEFNDRAYVDQSSTWQKLSGFDSPRIHLTDRGNPVADIKPGQAMATNIPARSLMIPEGQTGVIYLKFRALSDSRYWGGVFGMASKPVTSEDDLNVAWTLGNPGQGSRPNATFAILGDDKDEILLKNRGRMNKAYEDLKPEIKPDVWYSLWVTIDNSRDEVSMYIQGGDFEKRTELTHFRQAENDVFQFQTASASDLTHFVILNPTDPDVEHNPRTIQVDEINYFVQDGQTALAGN